MIVRDGALGHEWAPPGADNGVLCHQLAACPDTRRSNEPWKWQLLGLAAAEPVGPEDLAPVGARVASLASHERRLDLASDPESVEAFLDRVELGLAASVIQRSPAGVVVLVGLAGVADIDGLGRLSPGDALVAAGEDEPLALAVRAAGTGAVIAVARITPLGGQLLGWVP